MSGAIFALILRALMFFPLLVLFLLVFYLGYFGAYYLNIITSTASGNDVMPNWPGFSNVLDEILWPFVRILVIVGFSFGPWFVLLLVRNNQLVWLPYARMAAVAWGWLYLPMAALTVQLSGRYRSVLPHVVVPAVVQLMPGYLVVAGACAVVYFAAHWLRGYFHTLAYVGWLVSLLLSLYTFVFQARLIGLLYRRARPADETTAP
ncbi:MAG: hypothetical protein NTV22_13335 [bacterium]|nr:hypothetical protein [bacterium]